MVWCLMFFSGTLQGAITYPSLGKGKSSSNILWVGICDRSQEGMFSTRVVKGGGSKGRGFPNLP